MEWVNGYTRKDGTVVEGFWRHRRASGPRRDPKVDAGLDVLRRRRLQESRASIGLSHDDLVRVAEQFGVAEEQVRRDHAISHVLASISTMPEREELVFFGGTALSRSHLPDLRLSEDLDFLATGNRDRIVARLDAALPRSLQRTFSDVQWLTPLSSTSGSQPGVLELDGRARIQIQVLSADGFPPWPTEEHSLAQRYADAPPVELATFTPSAFVAAKTSAWHDRHAPRDLYDLWALAENGDFDASAAALYRRFGATGKLPAAWEFRNQLPSPSEWDKALSHQCVPRVGPDEAAARVWVAWSRLAA